MRYRHVKRGSTYRVLSESVFVNPLTQEEGYIVEVINLLDTPITAMVQNSTGGRNPFVLYQGEDMKYWLRPRAEFFDGRFQNIP